MKIIKIVKEEFKELKQYTNINTTKINFEIFKIKQLSK